MAIDWSTIIPKGAISGVVGWIVVKYRKPAFEWAKKMYNMPAEYEKQKKEIDELKSKAVISENVQHAVLRVYKNPIFRLNEKMEFNIVNPAFFEMTGFNDLQSVLGMRFMVAIPDEDAVRIEKIVEEAIKHPASYNKDIRIKHIITGVIVDAVCRMEPIRNEKGEVIEIIGQIFDKKKL